MRWGWIIGAALFGVAALSVYLAFRNPAFVAGLAAIAATAAWKAIKPVIVKRRSPELEAKDRHDNLSGKGDDYWRRRSGAPPRG